MSTDRDDFRWDGDDNVTVFPYRNVTVYPNGNVTVYPLFSVIFAAPTVFVSNHQMRWSYPQGFDIVRYSCILTNNSFPPPGHIKK